MNRRKKRRGLKHPYCPSEFMLIAVKSTAKIILIRNVSIQSLSPKFVLMIQTITSPQTSPLNSKLI